MAMKLFEKNPFIVPPGEFWADREFLWQILMEYIEIARMTRSNEIIALVGDYGCGTTHTLKYLEKFLKQKGAFVSYFTTPVRGSLSSLYRGFLEDIPAEKKERIMDKLVGELTDSPEAQARLERLSVQQIEAIVLAIISGRRLTLSQRRIAEDLGIFERFPSATETWGRILLDLTTEEWPAFVLIDEFDAALLDRASAQELLFDIRRLYDETFFGMCIVIGLKGEPKDVEMKLSPALYSRMSLQPIYIPPLSKKEGLNFLRDVLRHAYGERRKEFLPFEKESAETLIDISCPCTPRRLLRICSVVFEEARRNKLEIIDRDFVLKVVTKFGEVSISVPLPIAIAKPEARREAPLPILEGVIEYGTNGVPHILVTPSKLTAREVIGLVLYAKRPTTLSLREIRQLVLRNWKSVRMKYISANVSQMRGLVFKEGKRGSYRYKLSGSGESWIKDELVPQLKGEKREEKKEKRRGPGKAIYPPEIQRLKEKNFFGTKKSLDDVINEFESKGVPTRGKRTTILNALRRDTRKKDSKLKATKEDKTWIFWVD